MLRARSRAFFICVWALGFAGCNALLGNEDPSEYHLFADAGPDGTVDSSAQADARPDSSAVRDAAPDAMSPETGPPGCSPATCPTGCCDGDGQCQASSNSTCGTAGGSCIQCSASQSCASGACVEKCDTTTCPSGCCDATGTCQSGTTNASCGTNGAQCGACTGAHQCASGKCGCGTSADCPAGQACDPGSHSCGNTCVSGGQTLTCNGGCCDATGTGQCVAGTVGGQLCGLSGAACTDCSHSTQGHVCQSGGTCGCGVAGDCPLSDACNTATNICGPNLLRCRDDLHLQRRLLRPRQHRRVRGRDGGSGVRHGRRRLRELRVVGERSCLRDEWELRLHERRRLP